MQCNINAKGKAVRLVNGIVTIVIGLILLFAWSLRSGGTIAWVLTIFILFSGCFMIFEGWAGWCVIRAMGFKTKI